MAAVICRQLMALAGISEHLIAPPLIHLAIAVAVTLLVWLAVFGG